MDELCHCKQQKEMKVTSPSTAAETGPQLARAKSLRLASTYGIPAVRAVNNLNFGLGLWRLADPKISLASIASMLLGACAAAADGPLQSGWLALTVLGILAIETAKNASGEIFDFDSGADLAIAEPDRTPFSGGKRVLVDGLLTRRQTMLISVVTYALGAAAGFAIVFFREPRILWIGLAGMACAYFYHAPPLKLSYRGLGEVAVALCYGPLIALGTFLVQRGRVNWELVWLALPFGLLIGAFLWINEFPDCIADAAAGKRTCVVRLGKRRAAILFAALMLAAFAWLALLPVFDLPKTVWLGLVGLPTAVAAVRRVLGSPQDTARLIPAQAKTLITFLLYSAGTSLGLLMAR